MLDNNEGFKSVSKLVNHLSYYKAVKNKLSYFSIAQETITIIDQPEKTSKIN